MYEKRIDSWSNVPNSNVNDDGKPNLNDSNAENDNDARVLVRLGGTLVYAFAPATYLAASFGKFCLQFQSIRIIDKIKL